MCIKRLNNSGKVDTLFFHHILVAYIKSSGRLKSNRAADLSFMLWASGSGSVPPPRALSRTQPSDSGGDRRRDEMLKRLVDDGEQRARRKLPKCSGAKAVTCRSVVERQFSFAQLVLPWIFGERVRITLLVHEKFCAIVKIANHRAALWCRVVVA